MLSTSQFFSGRPASNRTTRRWTREGRISRARAPQMWSRTPQTSTSLVVACPLSIRGPWEAFRRQQGGYRRRAELQKRLKKIKGLRNIQVLNRKTRTIYWMMSGRRAVLNKHVITSYSSRQKKNPLLMQIFRSSESFLTKRKVQN